MKTRRLALMLATAATLPAFPGAAGAAAPRLEVRPAVGGPQSTFTVVFPTTTRFGWYTIRVAPRCAAATSSFPWVQHLQLLGRPLLGYSGSFQLPRPVTGGWCPGRFTGRVVDEAKKTRATFTFTVRRGVRTALPERPCEPRHSKTLAQTRTARVYTVRFGGSRWTVGCLFTVRGHMYLSRITFAGANGVDVQEISHVRLAGPFVAYMSGSAEAADFSYALGVTDLRTGRLLFGRGLLTDTVYGLVLSASGAIAWIAFDEEGDPPVNYLAVHGGGPGGYRELDRGDKIDKRSLRLDGSRLTWVNDGITKTAEL